MRVKVPRLVVAGLSGDSGKTLVSLGIARALADRGVKVRPFKKGPDYIDTAWLGVAARSTCRNLDTFLMPDEAMAGSLATAASDADLILVEGNAVALLLYNPLRNHAMRIEGERGCVKMQRRRTLR